MNQAMQFLNNMHQTRPQLNHLHEILQVIEAQLVPVTADTPVSVIYRLSDLIETANALQKKLMEQHFSNPSIPNNGMPFQFQFPQRDFSRRSPETPMGGWVMRHPGDRPTFVTPNVESDTLRGFADMCMYTYDKLFIDLGDKEKHTKFYDLNFGFVHVSGTNDYLLVTKKSENKISSEELSNRIRTAISSSNIVNYYNLPVNLRLLNGNDIHITDISRFKDFLDCLFSTAHRSETQTQSQPLPERLTILQLLNSLKAGNTLLTDEYLCKEIPNFKLTAEMVYGNNILLTATIVDDNVQNISYTNETLERALYTAGLWVSTDSKSKLSESTVMLRKHYGDNSVENSIPVTDYRQFYKWLIELNSVKHSSAAPDTSFMEKVAEPTADKKPVTLKQLFSFINKVRKSRTSDGIKVPNFKILGVVNQGKAILHIVPEKGAYIDLINICNRFQTYMTSNRLLTTNGNLLSRVKSLDVYLVKPGTTSEDQSNVKMLTDPEDFFGWVKSQGK